jgi:hypothetical protein
LTKYEVNFVARADLTAFNESDIKKELKKNYVILYDALLFHHFPEGFNMGYPGANGHHHKHLVRHCILAAFRTLRMAPTRVRAPATGVLLRG